MENERVMKQIRTLRIVLVSLAALFVLLGAIGMIGWSKLNRTGRNRAEIVEKPLSEAASTPIPEPTPDPFAEALRTGVDYYETGEIARVPIYSQEKIDRFTITILVVVKNGSVDDEARTTDMLFLVSYNQLMQRLSIVAIPRDTLIPVDEYGWKRVSAAYTIGDYPMLMNALNEGFGLDIQNYVYTGTDELAALADGVGGIPATLTEAEAAYINERTGAQLTAGKQQLTGEQIVCLLRDRASDDKGDLGRTEKQLTVITDAFGYLRSSFDKTFLVPFFTTVFQSIRTNLDFDTLMGIGYEMVVANELSIVTLRLPFDGAYTEMMLDGAYALLPVMEKNSILLRQTLFGKE